ncbi:ABC transporter substrate-binding protein [Aridibaculum aurantiacum]|uniref:ABC transporter substrate-binding protein n=1 Tax=Aridibaculum aurantiacum TaxID=2810307 RepID=UPI001A965E13|nr:helical backbone metal receptor [Aridibaculum aurantiacum]
MNVPPVNLSQTQRIVSLVPSQTELLYHLGLEDEVVGITKFCINPERWFRSKQRIGGTKTVDIEKVMLLKPTLIIANKEENVKEQVEALQEIAPVYVSDVNNLEEALEMISTIGTLTNKHEKAKEIKQTIQKNFEQLENADLLQLKQKLSCAYLIWREPYMAAAGDTFIGDMLRRCGFSNILEDTTRYPQVTKDQLAESGCDLLLLSSEPYPFKEKHIQELQQYLPATRIVLVDGEMFSWYGSRLVDAPKYFHQLLEEIRSNQVNC